MNERIILHSDLNNFYASVECLYHPEYRGKPLAVLGDPEARHGIVLAKNYEAKSRDVRTGDPKWMAEQKCPGIVFVPPHYDLYMKHSRLVRQIYSEYTDQVEPYGLDETTGQIIKDILGNTLFDLQNETYAGQSWTQMREANIGTINKQIEYYNGLITSGNS